MEQDCTKWGTKRQSKMSQLTTQLRQNITKMWKRIGPTSITNAAENTLAESKHTKSEQWYEQKF